MIPRLGTVPSAPSRRPIPRNIWLCPKHALFAFLGLTTAYVFHHNEHFLADAVLQWRELNRFRTATAAV